MWRRLMFKVGDKIKVKKGVSFQERWNGVYEILDIRKDRFYVLLGGKTGIFFENEMEFAETPVVAAKMVDYPTKKCGCSMIQLLREGCNCGGV